MKSRAIRVQRAAHRHTGPSGVIIVFVAAGLVMFLALVALALGVGVIMLARETSQNAANSAALAALEAWVSNPHAETVDRAELARTRAQEILDRARIPGTFAQASERPFGQVRFEWDSSDDSSGAEIQLGRLYPFDPTPNDADDDPCTGEYPCFVHYPSAEADQLGNTEAAVNAAQVILQTPLDNPLIAPFASVFGSAISEFRVTATATLVQRCTALLVDLSPSSFIETHRWTGGVTRGQSSPFPARFLFDAESPEDFAFGGFAMNVLYTKSDGSLAPLSAMNCNVVGGAGISTDPASIIWCNTRSARSGDPSVGRPWDGAQFTWGPGGANTNFAPVAPEHPAKELDKDTAALSRYQKFHYRDDYIARDSPFYGGQSFYIDSYVDDYYKGPEPFTSYMRGFNAALRALQLQQNALDKATLKGFVGFPLTEIPPALLAPEGDRLTSDLGYLIQITNMDNRGTFTRDADGNVSEVSPRVRPNFVDHGLFAVVSSNADSQNTNLVEILDTTIQHLAEECPANAKKQIILATDGVSSCSFETHTSASELGASDEESRTARRNCAYDFNNFLTSECQLMGMSGASLADPSKCSGRPVAEGGFEYPSILERLLQERISLTVLLAGSGVQPNFLNLSDGESLGEVGPWSGEGPILSYPKAVALGLSALNSDPGLNFVNQVSSCDPLGKEEGTDACEEAAYLNLGSSGYVFRRANGLARMSMLSGGLWCPLMPRLGEECYSEQGYIKDECRTGSTQTASTLNLDSATLAAQCTSQAVGYNPFMLFEPLKNCENASNTPGSPSC